MVCRLILSVMIAAAASYSSAFAEPANRSVPWARPLAQDYVIVHKVRDLWIIRTSVFVWAHQTS